MWTINVFDENKYKVCTCTVEGLYNDVLKIMRRVVGRKHWTWELVN